MMATHESLNYQQNVEVIQFMEEEVMRLARSRGFAGIFTTNTSPLTQVMLQPNKIIINIVLGYLSKCKFVLTF